MNAPTIRYVTTSDGWRIAYSVIGSGPPLVVMPTPFNHLLRRWEIRAGLFHALASHFQVIQYDHRGQGLSGRGLPPDVRIEDFLLDLEALFSELISEPALLWGNALHADLAVRFAVSQPRIVSGLILQGLRVKAENQVASRLQDLASTEWETFLEIMLSSNPHVPQAGNLLDGKQAPVNQLDWVRRVQAFEGADLTTLLPKISCPTLVWTAGQGPYERLDDGMEVSSLMPNARLMVIPPNDPHLTEVLVTFASELRQETGLKPHGHGVLSGRELEVLRLLAAGRSNQQVADELVISLNTVRRHVSNIFAKTSAANRADAVSYAHRHGLV